MKITIREEMVPGASLDEQLAWLDAMGIEGIELHGPSLDLNGERLRAIFAASDVSPSAIEGADGQVDPDPAARQQAKDQMRTRLDLAGALGAVGVLIVPQRGRVPLLPDLSPLATGAELERELLLHQLRELDTTALAVGVKMFLEPLNRFSAHLVNRVEQGVAIAEQAGASVAVMADFFHMNIEEADIPAALRAAGGRLVYVHVADSNRLQPGRGHIDFRPAFTALKAIGYDGYLGLECQVAGPYDEAIRESVALLRALWADA